jgi:2-succinyl-5-enolpyruvyl-6-hydroxy-3-cyclohexene-1-carboxylate synthase
MSERDATTAFATTLVDEWARAGVRHAVVSPGSRNAPLVLALARDGRLQVDVVLDERSAGFRALGVGRATGIPAFVGCTSGSAAANLLPAVVEAHHAGVPLLVCTADRPPELRDTGAGQTIDQTGLYGAAVRWFCDPGPPLDQPDAGAVWRSLASRAFASAVGTPPGPVHLNLPFREPLVPTGAPLVDAPGRDDGAPWTVAQPPRVYARAEVVERLAERVRRHRHGVLVVGWGAEVEPSTVDAFARASGWPVLADAISGQRRGPHAVSTYEALLRAPAFAGAHRPDVVVRIGAPLTSKLANAWLQRATRQVVVDPYAGWLDPAHTASELVVGEPAQVLDAVARVIGDPAPATAWSDSWHDAERQARGAIDAVLDNAEAAYEGRILRDIAAAIRDDATLAVASSLPVRALEWCMAPREGLRVIANRGTNGIDGFVSTVMGVAASGRPVVGVCGDLCFLHDTNGLLGANDRGSDGAPATFVVIDNEGGGIFSFLPPRELDEFEALFATPQGVDLVAVARAHGVPAERLDDLASLKGDVLGDGVRALVVPVDREASVARHRALWEAVAAAVAGTEGERD